METKDGITNLYTVPNPIVYRLIIIDIPHNSCYFSGIYYGQDTLNTNL